MTADAGPVLRGRFAPAVDRLPVRAVKFMPRATGQLYLAPLFPLGVGAKHFTKNGATHFILSGHSAVKENDIMDIEVKQNACTQNR